MLSGELGPLLLPLIPSPTSDEPDLDLGDYLDSERTQVNLELEAARNESLVYKRSLEELWFDSRNAEYELCSVFIHRGNSPSFGHYFFYSRDLPNNPDQWFKYNDSEVSIISKDEIFADSTGSSANPYLVCQSMFCPLIGCSLKLKPLHFQLVYARKGSNTIDTVHRILPTPVSS